MDLHITDQVSGLICVKLMAFKTCAKCSHHFNCTSNTDCWCMALPQIIPIPDSNNDNCLCPNCLNNQIQKSLQSGSVSDQNDFIFENGYLVMTKNYLLKRGYCCNHGCRNCPYK